MDICKARCEGNSECVAYDMATSSSVCTIYRTNTGTTNLADYTAVECSGRSKLQMPCFRQYDELHSIGYLDKFTIEITEDSFTSISTLDKHRIVQTFFRHCQISEEHIDLPSKTEKAESRLWGKSVGLQWD